MKASINEDLCQGHARCWDICPEVFDLDDDGHGVVIQEDVPAEVEAKAFEAARNCPERAITVA